MSAKTILGTDISKKINFSLKIWFIECFQGCRFNSELRKNQVYGNSLALGHGSKWAVMLMKKWKPLNTLRLFIEKSKLYSWGNKM